MARPERPLGVLSGPVAHLAADLRQLREKAGKPGYRQMAARANFSVATLSAAASGRRLPTLEVTLGYVAACNGDVGEWERRWREAERLSVAPARDAVAANGHGPSPYSGLAMFQPDPARPGLEDSDGAGRKRARSGSSVADRRATLTSSVSCSFSKVAGARRIRSSPGRDISGEPIVVDSIVAH